MLSADTNIATRKILVLGGHGFIGRHAVSALIESNQDVTIGSRYAKQSMQLPTVQIKLEAKLHQRDWLAVIEPYDVILNCVGILRPIADATYDRVHHLAPYALAEASASLNKRFIHISAIGLYDRAGSGFITSKLAGERAILQVDGDWIIVRPSLLDGEGGYGAAWLRGIAQLPFFVAPMDAQGGIAALTIEDLAQALVRLCVLDAKSLNLSQSREFELGGDSAWPFEAYIRGLRRRYTQSKSLCIPIPGWMARLGAHVCDFFRVTPFSYGHWELLRRDNIPNPNRLPELLARRPTVVIDNRDDPIKNIR